jgi:hypothetical protein
VFLRKRSFTMGDKKRLNRRVFNAAVAGVVLTLASASLTAYAAEQWWQSVCQKCGDKGAKNIAKGPAQDIDCSVVKNGVRCGGLRKFVKCKPPG